MKPDRRLILAEARNRLLAAWCCLLGRPVMHRVLLTGGHPSEKIDVEVRSLWMINCGLSAERVRGVVLSPHPFGENRP